MRSGVGVIASAYTVTATDVLLEPFNDYTTNGWVLTNTPTITASGRTGNAAQLDATDAASYNLASGVQSDTITIGFAWRFSIAASPLTVISLSSDAGATVHSHLRANTTSGVLTLHRGVGGTALITTAAVLPGINTFCYIEIQTKLHDTTGIAVMRVNGAEVGSFFGDTKNAGTKTVFDQIRLLSPVTGGPTGRFDDLYLTSGPGAVFKGAITIP